MLTVAPPLYEQPSSSVVLPEAKATWWTQAEIEEIGTLVADKLAYQRGDDLEPLVKRLGGRIEFQQLADWVGDVDEIEVRGPSDFTIYLSHFSGPLRDRFTVAHELGHYFLHSSMGEQPVRVRRHGRNRVESEANWFAAGFLMPKLEFAEQAAKCQNNAEHLAAIFRVSTQAAEVRLQSLGLR